MDNDIRLIREKIASYGSDTVSDAELVKIFVKGSFQPKLTESLLENIAKKNSKELALIYHLTKYQATSLKAAMELGRRIFSKSQELANLASPSAAAQYLMPRISRHEVEHFYVLYLNTKNRLTGYDLIAKGSLTCAVVHPREVFNAAIINRAASIIVAHNHPSGDPRPSVEDKELTRSLLATGMVLGIPVLDHVIIGNNRYYSFKENGNLS